MSETSIAALSSWDIQRAVRDCPPWMLNSYEKLMLIMLTTRWGNDGLMIPSFDLLEHDMACSRKTVNNTKSSLKGKGWLDYEPGNAHGQANSYMLTVPAYVGRTQATSRAGSPYVGFQYPARPGAGEAMPWELPTPSIPGILAKSTTLVSQGNYSSIPGKLDLVSQGNSKSKRKREIEEDNVRPPAHASHGRGADSSPIEDTLSGSTALAISPAARQPGSPTSTGLANRDSSAVSKPSIGLPSLATDKSRLAGGVEIMPPVPPGDDDPFVPGPNKTHWIRNNVTRKLFPADISLPPSWKGMSTTNLYLKPVEIAMLRDQGRIVYQAPTDSPAYSPDFDYND